MSDALQVTHIVRAETLLAAPKVLQAFFAATTDLYTYRLACNLYAFGSSVSLVALALTVFSPWQWFASVRTLSNSLETTLTIAALYYWPWDWFLEGTETSNQQTDRTTLGNRRNPKTKANNGHISVTTKFCVSLAAAALACILRPTNLMVWATISLTLILRFGNFSKAIALAQAAFVCGSAVLAISIGTDRTFYGEWVFPPLRFLYFNVVQSLAVFYGKNRADYYFTEGLPLLLTTALPFAAAGTWGAFLGGLTELTTQGIKERQIRFVLAVAVATSVIALSLISHKEVRFIYPLLPILHILAAEPMAAFFKPFPTPAKKTRFGLLILGLMLNVSIAFYTGCVHQRGVVDVTHFLRHEFEGRLATPSGTYLGLPPMHNNITVGFFMPCHSTPWRSHLICPQIDAWALTCEPPLHLTMEERESYLDEADVFYASPDAWIHENMKDRKTVMEGTEALRRFGLRDKDARRDWPHYLVFFQQLEPTMEGILKGTGYKECWRGFNTHWHDDWRRQGDVVVWCIR